MENETNLIISTLDRANACTMCACNDFEQTVPRARLLSPRVAFRMCLPSIARLLPTPSTRPQVIEFGRGAPDRAQRSWCLTKFAIGLA